MNLVRVAYTYGATPIVYPCDAYFLLLDLFILLDLFTYT